MGLRTAGLGGKGLIILRIHMTAIDVKYNKRVAMPYCQTDKALDS